MGATPMSDLPSMPYFVDDYEAATAHLTIEEDGAYMRLLRLCWRTPGCSIPDDPKWIKRHMRVSQEQFDEVVAPIIEEFFQKKNGRVLSKRLQKEFQYVSDKISERKKAGKKGGIAKSLKSKDTGSSKATDLPLAKDKQTPSKALAPTPTPTPTPNNKKEEALGREVDLEEGYRLGLTTIGLTDFPNKTHLDHIRKLIEETGVSSTPEDMAAEYEAHAVRRGQIVTNLAADLRLWVLGRKRMDRRPQNQINSKPPWELEAEEENRRIKEALDAIQ